MVRQFLRTSHIIKKDILFQESKQVAKADITEKVINEIHSFIEKKRKETSLNRNGKKYYKLSDYLNN